MGDVVEIARWKEENEPHMEGPAHCTCCQHHWHSVAPVGVYQLECPKCGSMKGIFTREVAYKDPYWRCNCGNFHFCITPDHIFCPNCGTKINGYR